MGAAKRQPPAYRTAFALALFVGVGLACNIRQDEFLCENAVSHLQKCCEGFTASHISCKYDDSGCGGTIYPEFNVDQSNCILAESCATLVSSGACSRATALPAWYPDTNCSIVCSTSACTCAGSGQPTVNVCP
jgi:hypothetical protein